MLNLSCDFCGDVLTVPGALLFSPPENGQCAKWHLCVRCYRKGAPQHGISWESAKIARLRAENDYVRACEERDAARRDVVDQIRASIPENLTNAHEVEAMGITLGDDSLALEGRARALATLFVKEALVVLSLSDQLPQETIDTEALGKDVLAAIDALPRDMTRAQKLRYMRTNAIHGFAEPIFEAVESHLGE